MTLHPSALSGVTSSHTEKQGQETLGTSVAQRVVGVALQHYRCHTIVAKATRALQISNAVEFRYQHLTQPEVTPMDRIVHGVNTLTCALKGAL